MSIANLINGQDKSWADINTSSIQFGSLQDPLSKFEEYGGTMSTSSCSGAGPTIAWQALKLGKNVYLRFAGTGTFTSGTESVNKLFVLTPTFGFSADLIPDITQVCGYVCFQDNGGFTQGFVQVFTNGTFQIVKATGTMTPSTNTSIFPPNGYTNIMYQTA